MLKITDDWGEVLTVNYQEFFSLCLAGLAYHCKRHREYHASSGYMVVELQKFLTR